MAKTVDLTRLADALRDYRFAFLITVDDGYRAHTTAVIPSYDGAALHIGRLGRHGRANLAERRGVTLIFPSGNPGEYSLIVDGDAESTADPDGDIRVTPRHALLHRPSTGELAYDCVMLTQQ